MRIIILIIFLVSINLSSQEKEVKDLEISKQNIKSTISKLNDSLKIIDIQIAAINSKNIKKTISDSTLISIAKKGAYIKSTPKVVGDIIAQLNEDKQITILDYYYKDDYFGGCIDSICGYLNEMWIEKNEKIEEFMKVKKYEQKEIERLQRENELKLQKEVYGALEKEYIKKYGQKTYDSLKSGHYLIGMNEEMATISLGSPKDINRTVTAWGVHEQWVYKNRYLYFKNGILTSYQD